MSWLISNLAGGVVRWCIGVLLTAACLFIGFSPETFLAEWLGRSASWLAGPWARLGAIVLGVTIMLGVFFWDRWARRLESAPSPDAATGGPSRRAIPEVAPNTNPADVANKCTAIDRVLEELKAVPPILRRVRQLQSGWRNLVAERSRDGLLQGLKEQRTRMYDLERATNDLRHEYEYYSDLRDLLSGGRIEKARQKVDKFIGAIGNLGDHPNDSAKFFGPFEQECIEGINLLQRWQEDVRAGLIAIRRSLSV